MLFGSGPCFLWQPAASERVTAAAAIREILYGLVESKFISFLRNVLVR
jgi:hypothetical protein